MNNAYEMAQEDELSQAGFANTASGSWSIRNLAATQSACKSPHGYLRPLGIGLVLALSPLTSLADPWVANRKRYTEPTARVLVEFLRRRRISLHKARQLALQLLAEMESARFQAADDEARRTFDIEDIV